MNADNIRTLYGYHFAANRKLWDTCIVPLTDEQFVQSLEYSRGSIRNQVVHLMHVEMGWFTNLSPNLSQPEDFRDAEEWPTRESIRQQWDSVEAKIRAYLADLTDEICQQTIEDEGRTLFKWQVMLHVINHATDHRAQILAMLHTLGGQTFAQDMVFYFWDDL